MWVQRFTAVKFDKNNTFKVWDKFLVCYFDSSEYTTQNECENAIKDIKKLHFVWQNKSGETFLTAT